MRKLGLGGRIGILRGISYEGGTSKGRLEIQDKSKFKKRFSNQVPSKFPKAHNDRVSNPRSQKGRGGDTQSDKPTVPSVVRSIRVNV